MSLKNVPTLRIKSMNYSQPWRHKYVVTILCVCWAFNIVANINIVLVGHQLHHVASNIYPDLYIFLGRL